MVGKYDWSSDFALLKKKSAWEIKLWEGLNISKLIQNIIYYSLVKYSPKTRFVNFKQD